MIHQVPDWATVAPRSKTVKPGGNGKYYGYLQQSFENTSATSFRPKKSSQKLLGWKKKKKKQTLHYTRKSGLSPAASLQILSQIVGSLKSPSVFSGIQLRAPLSAASRRWH